MASSFADPVHFGTFLFAGFVAATWLRHWIAAALCAAAAAFAVSKGFLLSSLVLMVVWARLYANPVVQAIAAFVVVGSGAAFYAFTASNSTGSTDLHIEGFIAAFTELPGNPIGRGLGNSGVRALTSLSNTESDVVESGVGLIISQLGLVGIAAFGIFFIALIRACFAVTDRRARLVAVGLSLSFLLNAMFNEVALSPNSAAAYFILAGLVIGSDHVRRLPHATPQGTSWN
jgi:hypothetical protein